MEVFVASHNGHKTAASREGVEQVFIHTPSTVIGEKVNPPIREQTEEEEETIEAAMKRLEELKKIIKDTRYDLLISIQNGVFRKKVGNREAWFDIAWVVVEDEDGNQSAVPSMGIEISEEDVAEARRRGFETTTVGSVTAERLGCDPTDPHLRHTNGVISRAEILRDAVKAAIGQLLSKSVKLREILSQSYS